VEVVFSYITVCRLPSGLTTIAVRTRKALGERKPPQTLCQFFPFCSPGGSTIIKLRFALSGNGKESFNPILDPDADPDHHQNLITSQPGQV